MSYSRSRMNAVGVSQTPSLLFNNLSTSGDKVSYVHKDTVQVFNEGAVEGKVDAEHKEIKIKGSALVLQAKWITVKGTDFLVVCTAEGVQVYDAGADHVVFSDDVGDRLAGKGASSMNFARGVTSLDCNSQFFVGTSCGEIAAFDVSASKITTSKDKPIGGHEDPICSLESDNASGNWVSSDDAGIIIARDSKHSTLASFKGLGHPCTSVAIRGDMVVGGYTSGHIRIYSIASASPIAYVAAHARAVNALALHPTLDMVATSGEDTILNVITLPAKGAKIKVVFTTSVTDRILTGIAFTKTGAQRHVLVSAYDSHSISAWFSEK